jgi:uncharacterized membrane protein YphA (DoxX/SURF4 family)
MAGLYANDASILDSIGRLLIVGTFLFFVMRNVRPWHVDDHIKRLALFGTPMPRKAFWCGIAMQVVGCALLLFNWHPAVGVFILLVFIAMAALLLLRFWEVDDPMKRLGMQNGFFADVMIFGGLLILWQRMMM